MRPVLVTGVAGCGFNSWRNILNVESPGKWANGTNWNRPDFQRFNLGVNPAYQHDAYLGHIWHGAKHFLSLAELADMNARLDEEEVITYLIWVEPYTLSRRIISYREDLRQGKFPGGTAISATGYNFKAELEHNEEAVVKGIVAQQDVLYRTLRYDDVVDLSDYTITDSTYIINRLY